MRTMIDSGARLTNISFRFRRTNRRDCIGITRTFTDSQKRRCWAARRRRWSSKVSNARCRIWLGMPERVLVIRDQNLANPDAAPVDVAKLPPVVLDADGDVMNTGTGTGKPAEDLTINYVPVPYPNYPPATDHNEAGRAATLACAERFGDYVFEFADIVRAAGTSRRSGGAGWSADPSEKAKG